MAFFVDELNMKMEHRWETTSSRYGSTRRKSYLGNT